MPALLEAVRFASDPPETVLERNDVVIVLQSDSQHHIAEAATALFGKLDVLVRLTSIRKGFVGGGYAGERSLQKAMAMNAGIPGAELIPETAQLFLGFTSTQRAALGPDRIANFETLPGLTDQWPNGYFRNGTALALSHIYEDIEKCSTTPSSGHRSPEPTRATRRRPRVSTLPRSRSASCSNRTGDGRRRAGGSGRRSLSRRRRPRPAGACRARSPGTR